MSDIGHWKDFSEFLTPDKVGVMQAPVVTAGATPSLPYDGGIGYAVAKWTKDPKLAADLVRSLTSTDALTAFYADAGAIASDTTIDVSQAGPAVATIVVRDQGRQARAARGAVVQDPGPDGTAVPAAPERVDHRRRGGEAAGRLRPGGLTSCRSEVRRRRSARPAGAGRRGSGEQPARRGDPAAARPSAAAARRAPRALRPGGAGRTDHRGAAAVAAAARRQLLLHR